MWFGVCASATRRQNLQAQRTKDTLPPRSGCFSIDVPYALLGPPAAAGLEGALTGRVLALRRFFDRVPRAKNGVSRAAGGTAGRGGHRVASGRPAHGRPCPA